MSIEYIEIKWDPELSEDSHEMDHLNKMLAENGISDEQIINIETTDCKHEYRVFYRGEEL